MTGTTFKAAHAAGEDWARTVKACLDGMSANDDDDDDDG